MRLEPGIYKIISKASFEFKTAYYLRVFYIDKKKYYSLNGGYAHQADDDGQIHLEGYTLSKKLTTRPKISKVKIKIEWKDADGDHFETNARNLEVLRSLFKEFPELARAAGSKKY